MGHKVNPKIFRIGTIYGWDSKWFARKGYQGLLRTDVKVRDFLKQTLREAAVDKIEIERKLNEAIITIHSGKPGFVIGRSGAGIEELKKRLNDKFFSGDKSKDGSAFGGKTKVQVNVVEVSHPTLSAAITVQNMIADLEKRMPFRRILKQTIDRAQKAGALGVKVMVSGRLNGAEISRREMLSWGSVPLQNLRADIDYAADFARTIFGAIGVKVWIYRGEIFDQSGIAPALRGPAERPFRPGGDRRGPSPSGGGRGGPRSSGRPASSGAGHSSAPRPAARPAATGAGTAGTAGAAAAPKATA
jgi:small subunit ribosomal protein S3